MFQECGKLIFTILVSVLVFSACAKKSESTSYTPPSSQQKLTNEEIEKAKSQITDAVKERLIPCSSDGFRYALRGGELIKIWHLQIAYNQNDIWLKEVEKANGSWLKKTFQFVKSDSIPKGEANDLLYQSYDVTEKKWSKWKVFEPQSFTADLITGGKPEIPEFYALYSIPRNGLCAAIKNNEPLQDFRKTQAEFDRDKEIQAKADKEKETQQLESNSQAEQKRIADENENKRISEEENKLKEEAAARKKDENEAIQVAKDFLDSNLKCGSYYYAVNKNNTVIYKYTDLDNFGFARTVRGYINWIVYTAKTVRIYKNGEWKNPYAPSQFNIAVTKENGKWIVAKDVGNLQIPNCSEMPN